MNGQAVPTSGTISMIRETHHALARWLRSFNIVLALSGMAIILTACAEPPSNEEVVLPEGFAIAENPASFDKLILIDLLKSRQFGELEALLTAYQAAFEEGEISDQVVEYAFESFAYSNPEMESLLDEWTAKFPSSYAAYMSRGVYFAHRAGIIRDLYPKTPPDVAAEIDMYQARAVEAASRAIAIKATLSVAYAHLDWIARQFGNPHIPKSNERHWVEQGLENAPRSMLLRLIHLQALAGLSGGTRDEIKSFIEATVKSFPPEADLGFLPGFADYAMAVMLSRSQRYVDAVKMIDRTLAVGDDPELRVQKAAHLTSLERHEEALTELNRAAQLSPQSVEILRRRANGRRKVDQNYNMLDDYSMLLELDPYNPRYLRWRGMNFFKMEMHEEALADLDRALVYGDFDPVMHLFRGHVLLAIPGRQAEALAELEQVTQMDPNHLGALLSYGQAIAGTDVYPSPERECKSMEIVQTYQRLCERHGHCPPGGLARATTILAEIEVPDAACG